MTTLTAKQVATRIGTDAKTFRKFLRSPSSPYEAVGQGGRCEFPAKELDDLRAKFNAWKGGKAKAAPKARPVGKIDAGNTQPRPDDPKMAKHAAAIGDKGRCLKPGCGMTPKHPIHIDPRKEPDFDNPEAPWDEFEPSDSDIANEPDIDIDDIMSEMEDD